MLWKVMKLGALTLGGAAVLGALALGPDVVSYVRTSCHSISREVKDNIPIDFELSRARDLLDQTGPEMENNIRLMAEQEVDIATLRGQIAQAAQSLADEKLRLAKLRDCLASSQTSFTFGDFTYSREQLTDELSRNFQELQEAENALTQKQELLIVRQKALAAAMQAMDEARAQQASLQAEVETLEGRFRLMQATSNGSEVAIDDSKLAQAGRVIEQVRREIDVSEQTLAQEAKFSHPIKIDVVNEKDLLSQVDAHLAGQPDAQQPPALASDAAPSGSAK